MSFRYKLKYYKDEDSEYTDESICDIHQIEKIISDFWTGEQIPNGLELIVIYNLAGESIILEHSGKEVFEVYYLPLNNSFLYHKKSRIDLIINTLSAFMDNNRNWLETNLNKTKNENRLIRANIQTKNFIYEITSKRIWTQINGTIIFGIPLGIIFIGTGILGLIKIPHGTILDITIPFLIIMGIYIWIPGLLIHSQYKKDNKDIKLKLSQGDNIIYFEREGLKRDLSKDDILKLTTVRNPWYKLPWSDYEYTEIEFKNGDILNLTNLIIEQFLMVHKFPNCKLLTRQSIYPSLARKTTIR